MTDNQIPSPEFFFLESPLYKGYKILTDFKPVNLIEFFTGNIDAYCIDCGRESIFNSPQEERCFFKKTNEMVHIQFGNAKFEEYLATEHNLKTRKFRRDFFCIRDKSHTMSFWGMVSDNKLMKIGQYPSLADLQKSYIKKYRSILNNDDYKELNRAIGLNAHGVGIGAFVYLRRIFERLINSVYLESNIGITKEDFDKYRVDEKIDALKDNLPEFLVKNRKIYSILSKGIHALADEECLRYFIPVKNGIEIILDERVSQKERIKKEVEISKNLEVIKNEINIIPSL